MDSTEPYFNFPLALALATHYDRIFIEDSLEVARHCFAVVAGDIAIEKTRALHPTIDLVEVENNIVELKKVHNSKVFGYIGAQGAAVVSLKSNNMDELAVTGSIRIYIK